MNLRHKVWSDEQRQAIDTSGDWRIGIFQTLEEAIGVFEIGNDVFRPGLEQLLGSRPTCDADESQSEPRRRPDVPDAVAYRNDAIEIFAPVRVARTRDGRADDQFARDAVFGEAAGNAMIIDARGAQLHFGGRLPAAGGDSLRPAAALHEPIERLGGAGNLREIRSVKPVVLFQQIDQTLFYRARFMVARVPPEIILEQMLRDARIADMRAINPVVGEDIKAVSVGESASEADFVDAAGLRQSSANVEDYEFHLSNLFSVRGQSGFGQERSGRPQLWKEFFVERHFQVRGAAGAAGAHSDADRPLDHLDVAQTPTDDQLVEFGQPFANVNPVAVAALVTVDGQNGFGARLEPLFIRRVRPQRGHDAERPQGLEEDVAQRGFA